MEELCSELAKSLHLSSTGEGICPSPVPGVWCTKYSRTSEYTKRYWRACLAIVAQGCKEVVLGRKIYRCDAAHYTATPIDLPVISRVATAEPTEPFLALMIDLDKPILGEVANQMEGDLPRGLGQPARALFRGKANERMLEAAVRLTKLFRSHEDVRVLGQLVIKEIFYDLLKGPEGAALRQYARSGSKMQKISQAVFALSSELDKELDIAALAELANMSRSAFFKCFKEVTAMSPVQYQKRLRLLEAKRLMLEEDETAERSAFKVGYKSASQFSREYSRMFGNAPVRDVSQAKDHASRAAYPS